jgi:hypothetical protein
VSRNFFSQREFSSGQWYFSQTIALLHFVRICFEGKPSGTGTLACVGFAALIVAEPKMTVPA